MLRKTTRGWELRSGLKIIFLEALLGAPLNRAPCANGAITRYEGHGSGLATRAFTTAFRLALPLAFSYPFVHLITQ